MHIADIYFIDAKIILTIIIKEAEKATKLLMRRHGYTYA